MIKLSKRLAALEARGGRGLFIVYEDTDGALWHHNPWHPERRLVTEAELDTARRERRALVRVCYTTRWRDLPALEGRPPDAA